MGQPLLWIIGLGVVAGAVSARPADGQRACPSTSLPAYSHNDYERKRPLDEALERGFRGVEVDLFLVDGVLRVGHSRRRAARSASFEALYLAPLRATVARCGVLTSDSRPFFLAIEFKEAAPAAYDSLVRLFGFYHELISREGRGTSIEVVLVGWYPPMAGHGSEADSLLSIQYRPTDADRVHPNVMPARVRLISVDYGKTIGRWWRPSADISRSIAAVAALKNAGPGRMFRVHNVPADDRLYNILLAAGVDLIGTTELAKTQRLLTRETER